MWMRARHTSSIGEAYARAAVSGISGTPQAGTPDPVYTKIRPLCSCTRNPPIDTLGGRAANGANVHCPSEANRHPRNGHSTVPSTTLPSTPRWAP
jgi:hypothetical protein